MAWKLGNSRSPCISATVPCCSAVSSACRCNADGVTSIEDEFAHQVGCDRGQPDRGQPAQRHAHDEVGIRGELVQHRRHGRRVVLR